LIKSDLKYLVDDRCCVVNGMVGKPDDNIIGNYMQKFGEIESIKTRTPEDSSFIVTFKSPTSAVGAMNKAEHIIDGNGVNIIPYRYGDDESDRKFRVVILEGLPKMTEGQLAAKFEDEGVALARICPMNTNIGYILLTKQNMAQRIIKSSPVAIQEIYHDEDERRAAKVTAYSYTQKIGKLEGGLRIAIAQELELVRTPTTNIADYYGLKWLKPRPPVQKVSPEKPMIDKIEKKRKSVSDLAPRVTPRIDPIAVSQIKRPRPAEQSPVAATANLLGNIMGDLSVEKDPGVLDRRNKKIQEFKCRAKQILLIFQLFLSIFQQFPIIFIDFTIICQPKLSIFIIISIDLPTISIYFPTISIDFPRISINFPTIYIYFPTISINFPTIPNNFHRCSNKFH